MDPKFISFDCYGTLTKFEIGETTRALYQGRLAPDALEIFLADFAHFRRDEVLGAWKPYADVIGDALARASAKHGLAHDPASAGAIYDAIPGWGPHPDVTAGLQKLAGRIPLVILSNSMRDLIMYNVDRLGAPFEHVFTAEEAGAYKPRFQAFEYMLAQLKCAPEDIMHVSCHYRYDIMTARDMGFGRRVFVDRGVEIVARGYETDIIPDIGALPGLLGL
ncbi:MAG: haloacid dehalogenase type II [Pseudomonadota bacterium]